MGTSSTCTTSWNIIQNFSSSIVLSLEFPLDNSFIPYRDYRPITKLFFLSFLHPSSDIQSFTAWLLQSLPLDFIFHFSRCPHKFFHSAFQKVHTGGDTAGRGGGINLQEQRREEQVEFGSSYDAIQIPTVSNVLDDSFILYNTISLSPSCCFFLVFLLLQIFNHLLLECFKPQDGFREWNFSSGPHRRMQEEWASWMEGRMKRRKNEEEEERSNRRQRCNTKD